MIALILACSLSYGDWDWSIFDGSPVAVAPVVKPTPDPPKPEPSLTPKVWTPIYRNDSRGVSCRGYTERDLDSFIRGRESVYAQQDELQKQQKAQQSLVQTQQTPRYRAVSVCDQQNGCRTVMMPY